MFKKTQDYLLLHRPLLWNLKIVPMAAIMVVIHILFFIAGYADGAVDFSEHNESYYFDWTEGFATITGVFISILLTLIWLVFYFRNNAFKSYYPKSNSALYREWLLIFVICIVNVSYPLTFAYAKDLRARNYYEESELMRRTDIISMVSLFADGGYRDSGDTLIEGKNGENIEIHRDTFKYGKRYYPLRSLLNKSITQFSVQDRLRDSLNERRVKQWLVHNQKDSVLWLMNEFDRIAKEHQAVSNMTPAKWLELVYDHPNFEKYITVGRMPFYIDTDDHIPYDPEEVTFPIDEMAVNPAKDTLSNTIKVERGTTYIYPKYYVPLRQIDNAYTAISRAWSDPDADEVVILTCIYFGLMLSLLIFSFRVTSGRSWLIAIVAFGVSALVIAIINFFLFKMILREFDIGRYDEELYFAIWLVIVLALLAYFLSSMHTRKWSDVILNIVLWLMPWVIPVIAMLLDAYFSETAVYINEVRVTPRSTLEVLVYDYPEACLAISVVIYVVFMYFFTMRIKKWRGIAEA
jgi:hypothetical protein